MFAARKTINWPNRERERERDNAAHSWMRQQPTDVFSTLAGLLHSSTELFDGLVQFIQHPQQFVTPAARPIIEVWIL
jgi:hypothetical protein